MSANSKCIAVLGVLSLVLGPIGCKSEPEDDGSADDSTGSTTSATPSMTSADDTGSDSSGGDDGPEPDQVELMCNRWRTDRVDLAEGTWSGDLGACDPGDISAQGRTNALRLVNLNRWLAGLPEVTTDPASDAMAQACALMMHANGTLSHSPPPDWTCYSDDGASSAGASNIAGGPGVMAVDLYMVDSGNATTLGHRRWILSNSIGPIGLGSTDTFSCMQVIGGAGAGTNEWTAWPPPGPFPLEGISPSFSSINETGWSIQSDTIDVSGANVEITADGAPRPVTVTDLQPGFGSSSAISIIPMGWIAEADTTYHVRIDGLANPVIEYDVQIVDCG